MTAACQNSVRSRRPRLRTRSNRLRSLLLVGIAMPLFSCAGTRPTDLGPTDGRLRACPSSPNCVSSDAPADDDHFVAGMELTGPEAWGRIADLLGERARTRVIERNPDYIHAEVRTLVMRYVDDLELHRRGLEVSVRSASRLGHSDLGVNRKRVESLRSSWRDAGLVR